MGLRDRLSAVAKDIGNTVSSVIDDPAKIGDVAKDLAERARASAEQDIVRSKEGIISGIDRVKTAIEDPELAGKLEKRFDNAAETTAKLAEHLYDTVADIFAPSKKKPPGGDGPAI